MTQRHEDSDDDTFVTLGFAFEKLETVEDVEKAKKKKEKEQYVTDERGRRRFHGAFTGGFSAGYFNTVGSKEGWTPSNFVSSKGKKSEFSGQRPEDFMDDEDLGDHGIAPRSVTAKEFFNQKSQQFQGSGMKREATESLRSVIPGAPPLQNLIVPARSTIGVSLLKAMGWKEGQGVGPKTTRYVAREGARKVYGCYLPGQGEEDRGEGSYPEAAEGFLFAPSDVKPWEVEGKDDLHGIGYRGIEGQSILGPRTAVKALYGMSGEAFGIGALEDDDAEEDNVYGVEALTSYDSTLAAEGDISMERKFGWTGGLQADGWSLSSFKKASKQTFDTQPPHPPGIWEDELLSDI